MIISELVSGIFKPISDVIEHLTMSGDDKAKLQQQVVGGQIAAAGAALDYERQLLAGQTDIIKAEAQGSGWLQKNWRPMLMVVFAGLIVSRWLGYSASNLPEAEALELWGIIKLGLGGYVAGRSVEKVAPAITAAIKASK